MRWITNDDDDDKEQLQSEPDLGLPLKWGALLSGI